MKSMTIKKPKYDPVTHLDKDGHDCYYNLRKGFENIEDSCTLSGASVLFEWSAKGCGFGQLYFYQAEDGKLHCDSETMGKEFVKRMLCQMVDDAEFRDYKDFPGTE